jgi:hypothetical protein
MKGRARRLLTVLAREGAATGEPVTVNDRELGALIGSNTVGRPRLVQYALRELRDNGSVQVTFHPETGVRAITVVYDALTDTPD